MTQLRKLQSKNNDYITLHLYMNTYQKLASNTYHHQNANFAPVQELAPAQVLPPVLEVLIGKGLAEEHLFQSSVYIKPLATRTEMDTDRL